MDAPGARASHVRPTPTSGGVAVVAACGAGALLFAALAPGAMLGGIAWGCVLAFALAAAAGGLGALDDRKALGPRLKLGLGALAAVAAGIALAPTRLPLTLDFDLPLPGWTGAAGAALWIVTAVNTVNFVDGANGLAPGGLLIAFAAMAAAAFLGREPALAALALAAAAGYAGFLPWNLRGRLFQGDAGALFGGALFALLQLLGTAAGALPLYFGPIALLPWLTDVLLTLLRRARGGRPLLQAHREHLYQRWLQATGRPHLALAWRNALVLVAASGAALVSEAAPRWQGVVFLLTLAAYVAGWVAASRRLDRRLSGA